MHHVFVFIFILLFRLSLTHITLFMSINICVRMRGVRLSERMGSICPLPVLTRGRCFSQCCLPVIIGSLEGFIVRGEQGPLAGRVVPPSTGRGSRGGGKHAGEWSQGEGIQRNSLHGIGSEGWV